jgi:hypothetical protein
MRHTPAWFAVITLMAGAGSSTVANAHHSAAPHFDMSKSVEVSGTLTSFRFVNPHSYIYFDVAGATGQPVSWRCELPARTSLARLGWSESLFTVGRRVTIKGSPARREDNVCYLETLTTDDGQRYSREQAVSRVEAVAAAPRAAVDAWGRANLAGLWVAQRRGPPGGGGPGGGPPGGGRPGGGRPGGPPSSDIATAAGQAATAAYDQRFDDPAVHCSPANIIFGWTHDENVNEIVQDKTTLTLKYGYMDLVRTIHLDQTQHPGKLQPSLGGHSIGRFEGNVLVVDTVGFAPGVLIPMSGLQHSQQLHVVERFSVDVAAGTLTREYRAGDALYLRSEWSGRDVMKASAEPFKAFACVELSGKNNQRPR